MPCAAQQIQPGVCESGAFPVICPQETLAQWRGRIVHNGQEWERTNTALQREKEAMIGHHSALKSALAKSREAQAQRLKQMSASR